MPNKNYLSGRRLEYAVQRDRELSGFKTIRASGSHGDWDVVAYRPNRKVEMIQCKVTTRESVAQKLLADFMEYTVPSISYHQTLCVKVKGKPSEEVTV